MDWYAHLLSRTVQKTGLFSKACLWSVFSDMKKELSKRRILQFSDIFMEYSISKIFSNKNQYKTASSSMHSLTHALCFVIARTSKRKQHMTEAYFLRFTCYEHPSSLFKRINTTINEVGYKYGCYIHRHHSFISISSYHRNEQVSTRNIVVGIGDQRCFQTKRWYGSR